MTILAHEIWHCGLSHFSREHGRIEDHVMWNHAIDHEVNSLLEDDGFKIPRGAILYRPYKGESAETLQRTKRLHVQLALLGGCSMHATRCHRRKAVRSLRHSWVFATVG